MGAAAGQVATEPAVTSAPGAAAKAAAALEQLGAKIERDARGRVIGAELVKLKLTDADAAHLAALADLESLTIEDCPASGAALAPIKPLVRLERLYLEGLQLDDASLVHLGKLTRLENLSLQNSGISGRGLAAIKGLKALRVLNLGGNRIDDAALAALAGLSELDTIVLDGTQVTDAGLKHLSGLSKLRVLNLSHSKITGAGLNHLLPLHELRMLYCYETAAKPSELLKFRKSMSGLAVYY